MKLNFSNIPDKKVIIKLARDPLYMSSIFIALSRIGDSACGFLFWVIAARFYKIDDVGVATALISSLWIIIYVSRLGFDISIIRFFPTNDRAKVLITCLIITTASTILVGVIYILLVEFISPSLAFLKDGVYALLFLSIVVVTSVALMTGGALLADKNSYCYFIQHLFMAVRLLFLVFLTFLGSVGIFSSLGISYLAGSIFGVIIFRKYILAERLKIDGDFIRRSLRFSSMNYASNILFLAPTLLLPILVLNMLGEAEAAKYYIVFSIGNIVMIIPFSLGTSLFVEASHGNDLKKNLIQAGGACLILLIPAVLIIFFYGDWFLRLLGSEYIEAFDLLRILALSSVMAAVYSLFTPILNVKMKVENLVMLNAIRCMFLLGLCYMLIQPYGILGIGYGWMITYGILNIIIGMMSWRDKWLIHILPGRSI